MRMKLALLLFALAAVAPAGAISPAAAARMPWTPASLSCPSGQHLVVCPTRTFCCPDFAKCVCLPF